MTGFSLGWVGIVLAVAVIGARVAWYFLAGEIDDAIGEALSRANVCRARLHPAEPQQYTGEAGYQQYQRGKRRFYLRVQKLDVPDGTTLQLLVNNEPVRRLSVLDGWINWELDEKRSDTLPDFGVGDRLSLELDGSVLLAGEFKPT